MNVHCTGSSVPAVQMRLLKRCACKTAAWATSAGKAEQAAQLEDIPTALGRVSMQSLWCLGIFPVCVYLMSYLKWNSSFDFIILCVYYTPFHFYCLLQEIQENLLSWSKDDDYFKRFPLSPQHLLLGGLQ